MLHLRLVPDDGFAERKSGVYLGDEVDKEFDGLLDRLNAPRWLYTINDSSCYGGFGEEPSGKIMHSITEQEPIQGWRYHEAHLGFGLNLTQKGEQFLEGVKEIIRKNREYAHLANNYPRHQKGVDILRPNEFHFGIMPMNGKRVEELPITIDFSSREEAEHLVGIRDKIWQEVVELISSY